MSGGILWRVEVVSGIMRILFYITLGDMTPTLVFGIETIPDINGLRILRGLDACVRDRDAVEMVFQQRRQLHTIINENG